MTQETIDKVLRLSQELKFWKEEHDELKKVYDSIKCLSQKRLTHDDLTSILISIKECNTLHKLPMDEEDLACIIHAEL